MKENGAGRRRFLYARDASPRSLRAGKATVLIQVRQEALRWLRMRAFNEHQAFCAKSAPHPPLYQVRGRLFGHLLPACGEKDTRASFSFRHKHGETAPLSLRSGGKDDLLARHAAQVIRTPGALRPAGVGAEGG
jgi:hypothetical protein